MRILQAPSNIANQAWLMAQGLRSLGHEVEMWGYGTTGFDYQVDRRIDVADGPHAYWRTLVEAVEADFDVVHFHYGRSLMPFTGDLPWLWDLPIWRSLGVTVVFTFHGSDIRLRSHHVEDDAWSFYRFADIDCDEVRIEANLHIIRRYAQAMTVGSVLDLSYVPDAKYVPKMVDAALLATPSAGPRAHRPLVVHAPSRRAMKGTDALLAGLDSLRARGLEFDVDLVEGVSHGEAIERMAHADIVVEKLLGGDAGVTSLEAMALGKVAVARIRPEVRARHPGMPVVSANPDTFLDVMTDLLAAPDRRARLGQQGRAYIEADHVPAVVAPRLEALYSGRPRRGIPSYPGWTVPRPEAEAENLRLRLAKAQSQIGELKTVIKHVRRRRRVAVKKLARAEERLAQVAASPPLLRKLLAGPPRS